MRSLKKSKSSGGIGEKLRRIKEKKNPQAHSAIIKKLDKEKRSVSFPFQCIDTTQLIGTKSFKNSTPR